VENVKDNKFVIAGKPGSEVHWLVTGERKDMSAEVTTIIAPVEQRKTGDLVGESLDDRFLAGMMSQLEKMGYGNKYKFRTLSGRQRYENMKKQTEDSK
jgi:hypothetical protein